MLRTPSRLRYLVLLAVLAASGCEFFTGEAKRHPAPIEFTIQSPYDDVRTFAIAPTINLSGSRDFDPLTVSDTLYTEMQQVQNLNVLPVNKTLIAMNRLNLQSIEKPADAQKLAEALGADALIVPAVTAYDPYDPPVVGMILQMYTPNYVNGPASQSRLRSNRDSDLHTVKTNPDTPIIVADVSASASPAARASQPVSQVSAVFNATNQTVLKELQVFAAGRTQYDTALSDHKFLLDSDAYMRFVAHAMIRRLMDVERSRDSDR